jgi:RimJ/RimL family protein N-acetyltransferase
MIKLRSVYSVPDAGRHLYRLMEERTDKVNISHRAMPSWAAHVKFVQSKPYRAWYLIEVDGEMVGATYLSRQDEIGVFLFQAHRGRGIGPKAVAALMKRHPRKRFLANINPRNKGSIAMFESMGFHHIQNTYELDG